MSKAKGGFDASKHVRKGLNAETVTKLKEVFDVFDYDGSGKISIEELINTIKALNLESQADQILSVVNGAGVSGEFDFSTFLDIFGFSSDPGNTGNLEQVFASFDIYGTGSFGVQEFEQVAASVGENFSTAEVDQMIEYADKDKDGVINFREFFDVVAKIYPKF